MAKKCKNTKQSQQTLCCVEHYIKRPKGIWMSLDAQTNEHTKDTRHTKRWKKGFFSQSLTNSLYLQFDYTYIAMLFLNKTWHYGYLKMSNVVCQVNLNITCFLQDLLFSWICWKWNWKFNFLKLFYLLSLALRHFVTLTEYGPHCGCQLFHLVVNWLISTHLQLLLRHPSKI